MATKTIQQKVKANVGSDDLIPFRVMAVDIALRAQYVDLTMHSNDSLTGTFAEYASTNKSKGTIEQRLTKLEG